MHVSGFPFDLNPLLQFILTAAVIAIGILHLVKNTASKYFTVDANFDQGEGGGSGRREVVLGRNHPNQMVAVATSGDSCAVCGKNGFKQCSKCKRVRYCSGTCQSKHWKEGHNRKCQGLSLFGGLNATLTSSSGMKASTASKSTKELSQLKKVLFPYEDFVKLFNWGKGGFPPCGLLNCGNSCYANVVLQCLSCTRPLIAYLLEISHRRKCPRTDWCFLCELETHLEKASHSSRPFSPINILSRLPNIGGNLGYGKQEDAHEFMRFAIDTMQSVCLDEYGGEKAIHPDSQETTLIQYIFGGHLQSQVKCSKCNKISYRHENMMDLTVEIQGDAESLVECLDQFTTEECLDGENMYKCDGCNDYVKACKRLAIHCAPNVLTIALKRFQSGRFGKLNKRVTFPEILDLGPYMSKPGYGTDVYRLYAVVVHIDMLNASYFGHYICYTKDFSGNWYRIDDCKVATVELEEVLSQGAYMLLYSRVCPRPCVRSLESCVEKQQLVEEPQSSLQANAESITIEPSINMHADLRSPVEEEKKQGLVAIEEAKPCSGLPVECIMVDGPLNSLSTRATTDMRSPTKEHSSEKGDSVCMNIDNVVEVNSRFVENDPPSTSADVPISSESSSLDMDIDGPTMFDPRGDKLGVDVVNPESGLGTCMDNYGCKHSDAKVRPADILSEPSPLVEVHLDRQPAGMDSVYNSVDSGDTSGNQESVRKESSTVHRVPSQRMIPCSGLQSDMKIVPEKNSASSQCPSLPLSEQLQTAKPDNVIPAMHVSKKNTSKSAGDKSYCNGKQKPMFLRGFLDKHSRCKSPSRKVDVFVKPGESCKGKSNCNGHNKPGVSQDTNVVDGNGTIHPDGLQTPGFVNGRSEKQSNGVGPTDSLSFEEAEVGPVKLDHYFPISADSPGSFLPTGAHDLGHEQDSPNINLEHSFGNGYSCNNLASEEVLSLPSQMDQEMDAISSSVPVVASSSDTEMLDESTSVTIFRGQQSSSLACTTSIEPSDNVKAAQKIQVLLSNSEDGPLGFSEMQTKGEFREKNDASDAAGEVGFSCKANYCNGSIIPGSHFEECRRDTNKDRNSDCYNLSKSTSIVGNQCKGTLVYGDESSNSAAHKDGDLPWDHCNGNNSYNDEDENMVCKQDQGRGTFCSNGEVLLTPGAWEKSLKEVEEGPREMVSSNNGQNKQERLI